MRGIGSSCGVCKFFRRKYVTGCVFVPYFYYEEGGSYFAIIYKVFGASNFSKPLADIPITDRCEAAVTISYEAQARLQDPIYGCVSQILSLQQELENSGADWGGMHNQFDDPYFSGSSKTGDNMISTNTNFSHPVFNNNPARKENYMSSTTTHEEPNEQWVLLQEDAHMDDLFNLLLS